MVDPGASGTQPAPRRSRAAAWTRPRLAAARLAFALLPAAASGGPAWAQAAPLAIGSPVRGTLGAAGDPVSVALDLAAQDYVEGMLDSGEVPVDLTLTDADGAPRRRLLTASTGRATFRFVAEAVPLALRVQAAGPGAFTLALRRRVGQAEQGPPAPDHASALIAAAAAALARGEGSGAFWEEAARRGTPLVEPGPAGQAVLTFLVRGATRNAKLFGAPFPDHVALERLGDSDIWFRSFLVPTSTRLSYQIAPDIPEIPGTARERRVAILSRVQADPLNRHPWPTDAPDRFNRSSVVELPDAPPQPGLEPAGPPRGTLLRERFDSARLGNARMVTLYRTPGFVAGDPRALLLLVFDGDAYQSRIPTPTILDNLVAAGRLPPVAAVFIPNPDPEARARELPANPAFAAMLAEELLPWVEARLGVLPPPGRTVLAGSSYGGLAAATAALARSDRFGNAIALSGSFWWHPPDAPADRPEHVAGLVAGQERRPVRFFLSAGLFEGARTGADGILETTRHLRDVLEARDYAVTYREYAAGHDEYAWRGALGDGLLTMFGEAPGAAAR